MRAGPAMVIFYQKTSLIASALDGLTFEKARSTMGAIMTEKDDQGAKVGQEPGDIVEYTMRVTMGGRSNRNVTAGPLEPNSIEYKSALASQVMTCLTRVLHRERVDPAQRAKIRAIVRGQDGEADLSVAAVRALSRAGLLKPFIGGTKQMDDPGWKDTGESTIGKPTHCRWEKYFVALPGVHDLSLKLSAKQIKTEDNTVNGVDFQRWVLKREDGLFRKYRQPAPNSSLGS